MPVSQNSFLRVSRLMFVRDRIWEGMGICETRLGHFQTAQALLDRAKRACVKAPGAGDESQEEKYEPAAASVFVALSELYSAQGEYEAGVDCLERAWEIKDEELGSDHPQARPRPVCACPPCVARREVPPGPRIPPAHASPRPTHPPGPRIPPAHASPRPSVPAAHIRMRGARASVSWSHGSEPRPSRGGRPQEAWRRRGARRGTSRPSGASTPRC
jgi:hypothetical protein